MALLNRDQILGADDLQRELVPVPEWGGEVYVRVMTGEEKEWWEASLFNDDGEQNSIKENIKNMRAKLAVASVCDEQGTSLFCLADMLLLSKKSSTALDRVYDVAKRLNKISKEEEETLLKNSVPDQGAASSSDSPSPSA